MDHVFEIRPRRTSTVLRPDADRIVGRPYIPGDDPDLQGQQRLNGIAARIMQLTEEEVKVGLEDVRIRFAGRHRDLEQMLLRNSRPLTQALGEIRDDRRLLAGAYLTHEYSFEAAAITNPSIVKAPDQGGVPDGAVRVILSLRAIGEGHLSSIEFRSGVVHADGNVDLDPAPATTETGERRPPVYERKLFSMKLQELRADAGFAALVLDQLPRLFNAEQLAQALIVLDDQPRALVHETTRLIRWLAASNYVLEFDKRTAVTERLLWPESPFESRGMEDARFVHFTEDDGTTTYYATYTAFDGFEIMPQLIETNDFCSFEISTVNGPYAQNKGMALFPRAIGGRYMALARPDRENIHLLRSDNPRFWAAPSQLLRRPERPWELIQMGNCGSPLETEAGWLVLTHGVGPMRTYRLGAMLLDLEQPQRIIADLPVPILEATEEERNGYVPNVVYSCGGLLHGGRLILPYGIADRNTGIVVYDLSELLDALLANPVADDEH